MSVLTSYYEKDTGVLNLSCTVFPAKVRITLQDRRMRQVYSARPRDYEPTERVESAPKTDAQVVAVIRAYIDSHGYSPSMRDIAKAIGLSVSPTKRRLDLMRDKGLITFESGKPRTIKVVE